MRSLTRQFTISSLKFTLLSTSVLLAPSEHALAQSVQELPGIIVQGTSIAVGATHQRTNGTAAGISASGQEDGAAEASAAGQPIGHQGSSVTVVTGEDLQRRQIRNAADALRSLPGVSVSRQGNPQNLTVVRLRGAESNHTLVLIDGVEVNSGNSDGFFDFSNLTTEDIERIEVLRGPQSGLYGGSAVGGVINIITKRGKGPLTIRASAEAGSYRTGGGSLQISGGDDRLQGSLTLSGRRTDGFNVSLTGDENDFGRFSNIGFNGGVRLLDNLKIEGTLRQSEVRGGRDNGFSGTLGAFAVPADDGSTFSSTLWLGRLAATLDTLDGRLTHQFRVGRAEITNTDHDASFLSDSRTIGINSKYGYSTTYRLDAPSAAPVRHFLTGLIEREEESFVQPVGGDGIERERGRTSLAGEIRGEYFNTLYLTGTLRRDDNELFEDAMTWRTAASLLVPGTPFRLHGSYGTAVKYPSFSEQFGFFIGFIPNPDLKPEESRGWDAGIETTAFGGRAVLDVTYFNQDLHDEIDFRTIPVFSFQPFNRAGTSKRQGVEVAARYLMLPGLTLAASYTYLDAREDDGSEEIRRPPHTGRIDVNYAFDRDRANLNIAAVYNGRMKDTAFEAGPPFGSQIVSLDDYWLITAAASYRLQPGVEVYGRVENVLDQKYQEVFGYNTGGVAAYAGMRFTFEAKSGRLEAEW
jgi:vitamin B12 transporter